MFLYECNRCGLQTARPTERWIKAEVNTYTGYLSNAQHLHWCPDCAPKVLERMLEKPITDGVKVETPEPPPADPPLWRKLLTG